MEFVDTHCHIHFDDYGLDPDEVINSARQAGVNRLICVGCSIEDSEYGVKFAARRDNCWASIGLHPHEAHHYSKDGESLLKLKTLATQPKVVAIGECGLDYYYNHSPKEAQKELLKFQLDLAAEYDLPVIFHVRDSFNDFWEIYDRYPKIRGVVHSFSANETRLEQVLERGLLVGLNGIMTFTKDSRQLNAAKQVPLDKLLLETDSPFLTPKPFRGSICEPKHVSVVAGFLSDLRGQTLEEIAAASTRNAINLFNLNPKKEV